MREPRTELIVKELKEVVNRLNRLDSILQNMDVRYTLHRTRVDEPWRLDDIIQRVEY
jgi:hypothetical protein